MHNVFVIHSLIALLVSLAMVVSQVLLIVYVRTSEEIIQDILRGYVIIFSFFFMLAELQIETIVQFVPALKNWTFRGFLYTFVATIGTFRYRGRILSNK